ncbi:hypothetical protein [Nocardioides acrostichi]|uniref:Uncharacterized protein n=1 Tax=Nocardioides acrostichi TaxID=2784339 RepID=A0A930UXL6_9ACTN|nr:hypothetical protein [Nocardioides acrostichi]MBF4161562.1 hypothetical protein [Nocardioides acrostichi]
MSATPHALVDLDLAPPVDGEATLTHDATFESWDFAFSLARDTINVAIHGLNGLGAGLPTLPEGSLEDLVVAPLTGDYGAIRGNGLALHEVDDALGVIGLNTASVARSVASEWHGLAGAACSARLAGASAGVAAVGELLGHGSVLFDGMARVSEQLGVRVEKLVVQVGTALARLVRKVATRFAGPAAWAALGLEIAQKGWGVVQDVIDDVEMVYDGIMNFLDLKADAIAWAEDCEHRLGVLAELPRRLQEALS